MIRPLEWQDVTFTMTNIRCRAETMLGVYVVYCSDYAPESWAWKLWRRPAPGTAVSQEAAKAAAQADYEQRVRSMLVSEALEEFKPEDA